MTSELCSRIKLVEQRIEHACLSCGRDPADISLLLATKTQPPQRILEALSCGPYTIGENRVQELVEKAPGLAGQPVERHLIGHLQSNKAGKALDLVTCVQSIDRLAIAEKLNRLCADRGRTLDVFLQFNTSGEVSKFGMDPGEAVPFAKAVARLPNLRVRGLMTIGLLTPTPVLSRDSLAALRELRDEIAGARIENVALKHLSMGMSLDLEIAIEEGSTMVRVGTDVFGKRKPPAGSYWPEKDWAHLDDGPSGFRQTDASTKQNTEIS